MKRHLLTALLCAAAIPALAQAPAPAARTAPPPVPYGMPNGTLNNIPQMLNQNSRGFPAPNAVEGQPIETRAPEKADDKPAFPGQTRAPFHATQPYAVSTVTSDLHTPWSLAFLPDGKMLVTEKNDGAIVIVSPDGTVSQPLSGVPKVVAIGQGGLLDIVLDPKFSANHRVYFSYSEPRAAEHDIAMSGVAIARATLDEASGALNDLKVIFHAQPALPAQALSSNQGCRLVFGKDGYIYATIGDRSKSPPWEVAQKPESDLGKMIRITTDGDAAPGNPFAKTLYPEIWTLGHRSEEGITTDPQGRVWEVEDGPRGGDELNLLIKGHNYGWPIITHAIDYPGETIEEGLTAKAGMEQPRYYWDPVIAPSGIAFYTGNKFPQWKNSVFIGGLRAMFLDRLTISGDKVVNEEPLLVDQKARIRDVRVHDGLVYVLTDSGKLLKISPK